MGLVVNNICKMEWDKAGWLELRIDVPEDKKNVKKMAFIFGSQTYTSTVWKKKLTVFFNPDTAFLWASDAGTDKEDFWEASDLIRWFKREKDFMFPYNYDEYIPIIKSGEDECIEEVLARYGLSEYKKDIEERLQDVVPFSADLDLDKE